MKRPFQTFGCCLAVLVTGSLSFAQKPVDVSQCFSPVLQQVRTFSSLTRLDLAYLAQMSEDNWKSSSNNGALSVAGIAARSYSNFQAEREKRFQETSLNLSYFQSVNTSSVTLDADAYDVIKECLRTQASRQGGLTYVVTSHDESDVSIRFYWHPSTPPYELPVRATADNAKTLDPDASGKQLFSPTAKLLPDGPVLELTRLNADKAIRIVLKTTPSIGYEPIYIKPFDPSPKFRDTWILSTFADNPDPEKFKTGEENYNSIYDLSKELPGPIISTDCSFNAAYYHMEVCQPSTTSIMHCRANKQRSDTRSLWAMKVQYLKPIKKCVKNCGTEEPPAIVDEDTPANYSFNSVQQLNATLTGCTWQARKVR